MKKFVVLGSVIMMLTVFLPCAYASDKNEDIIISNRFFSVALPNKAKGTYVVKKQKNGIFIYEKQSRKAGFGGFAFGIKPYKNPSDHAVMPGSRKIGELSDKKGTLYDMVLIQPTDVQHDYTKNSKAPEEYALLYDLGETVEIKGVRSNKYFKNQGMKGKDLYADVLKKHIKAINEKWDSIKLEKENMSYMYNVLAHSNKNVLDKTGYTYYDVNGDGIEELMIGEIANGEWKGVIYDIYTMVDRKPVHVISGGTRNRFYVCDEAFICNEYSSGASESGLLVYNLVENSNELYPQVGFKYDGYRSKTNPWFISYRFWDVEWEPVSKKYFNERKATFEKYERFDYTPLSKVKF